MKFNIIENTEEQGSVEIESFDTPEEAKDHLKQIIECKINPYYDDLIGMGGSLRIEDDNGNEIN